MNVVVTRKYQVTIPKSVRSRLGINVGDRLRVSVVGEDVVLKPVKEIPDPVEFLWSLTERHGMAPLSVDAVKLVEESLEEEDKPLHRHERLRLRGA